MAGPGEYVADATEGITRVEDLPKSHYTHRVVTVAVRLVVEDGLPYRAASWHLWRDHRVFVPFATIQNWVEAGGKKGRATRHRRIPRRRSG